jgi:SAM-dependent methyltransferase
MAWFEDGTFWKTFYDHMFTDARLAAASDEVERALVLTGVAEGAVLDLCCGPGRHSVALARKGFHVTGVDRSPFLLSKARDAAAGMGVELIESDMRDFVRPGAFDLALSLFTSFGYFETREQDFGVLKNVNASLKKGGVFLIDIIGAEVLATRPCRTRWEESASGEIYVEHTQILPGWSRLHNQWLLVKGQQTTRFEFEHNLYSGQELLSLLKRVGFSDVHLFGSLDGRPSDSTAARLVARARVS